MKGDAPVTQIDEASADSLGRDDFDAAYLQADRPLVIRGGMGPAPAFGLWTSEYLTERLGHRLIQVTESDTRVFNPNADSGMGATVERQERFAVAMRLVAVPGEGSLFYAMQQSIPDKLPEIADDVPAPRWIPDRGVLAKINLWLGAGRSTSPLHFDARQNFLGMIWGSKRFTLYAPSDTPKLYPARESRHRHVSQVDALSPDFKRFPRFREAVPYGATLGPGDMIFMPSRWWHLVESLEMSLSVNYWWDTDETEKIRRATQAMRRLTRRSP